MAFTAQELENAINAHLDFKLREQPMSQIKQVRPLFDDLMAGKKNFGGGKEFIDGPVKGVYSSSMVGYSHDDEQSFVNPANIKRWKAKWYELGSGITITFTELKQNGIHVTDSVTGASTSRASDSEVYALCNILDDKFEDLEEGSKRSVASMLWQDGTQDAKAVPGIRSFILNSPTTGTSFGLSRVANSWWRNRASVSINTTTATDQNLVTTLQTEMRQLRKHGNPKHKMYAGYVLLREWEKELRSKGNYTLEGWRSKGTMDASMADIAFKGIDVQYDPTLDDLGLQNYLFVLDMNAIKFEEMEGEGWKIHTPARPYNKYELYRSMTLTGALRANQLNTSGVYATVATS